MPAKTPVQVLIATCREQRDFEKRFPAFTKSAPTKKALALAKREQAELQERVVVALRAYIQDTLVDGKMRPRELSGHPCYVVPVLHRVRNNRVSSHADPRFHAFNVKPKRIYSKIRPEDVKGEWHNCSRMCLTGVAQAENRDNKWYEVGRPFTGMANKLRPDGTASGNMEKVDCAIPEENLARGIIKVRGRSDIDTNHDLVYSTRLPAPKHNSGTGKQVVWSLVLGQQRYRNKADWLELPTTRQYNLRRGLFPPRRPIDQEFDCEAFILVAFGNGSVWQNLPMDLKKVLHYWAVRHFNVRDQVQQFRQLETRYGMLLWSGDINPYLQLND